MMKNEKAKNKSGKLIRLFIALLLTAAMCICFAGCRDRIANREDADKIAKDEGGIRNTEYEKRRTDLGLSLTADTKPKNDEETAREKQQEQKKEEKKKEKKKEEKKKEKQREKKNREEDKNKGERKKTAKADNKEKENSGKDNSKAKEKKAENSGKEKDNNKKKGDKDKGNTEKENNEAGNGENGSENGNGNGSTNSGGNGNNSSSNGNGNNNKEESQSDNTDQGKTITVHFDANGGKVLPQSNENKEYTSGKKFRSMPTAKKDDCVFAGWYTEKDGGNAVEVTDIVPGEDITLYAHWVKSGDIFTLTFDPAGGSISNSEKTRDIVSGDTYGSMPEPIKDGHEFLGWFTKAEGGRKITPSSVFNGTSDLTLYAHWEYDPYKYWSTMRQRIYESMYACQIVDCYLEFEDNKTTTSCSLLENAKIGNIARNRGSETTVTDEWVEDRNPYAIVKCKGSSSDAASIKSSVKKRFPGRRVIVVPASAVSGSNNERLYYTLCLGKAIYPDWFKDVDIAKMSKDLGVNGSAYE